METPIPIGVLMKITEKEFERRLNEIAHKLELTASQMHVLQFISQHPDRICQRDLEERFALSHATVSGLIGRLEQKGFVCVEVDGVDKRKKAITLTQQANSCINEIDSFLSNSDPQLMHGFSDEEQILFRSFLLRVLSNIGISLSDTADPQESKNVMLSDI